MAGPAGTARSGFGRRTAVQPPSRTPVGVWTSAGTCARLHAGCPIRSIRWRLFVVCVRMCAACMRAYTCVRVGWATCCVGHGCGLPGGPNGDADAGGGTPAPTRVPFRKNRYREKDFIVLRLKLPPPPPVPSSSSSSFSSSSKV